MAGGHFGGISPSGAELPRHAADYSRERLAALGPDERYCRATMPDVPGDSGVARKYRQTSLSQCRDVALLCLTDKLMIILLARWVLYTAGMSPLLPSEHLRKEGLPSYEPLSCGRGLALVRG